MVSFAALIVLTPIVIWKRQLFHQLLIRFVIAAFVLAVYYNPFYYKIPMSLSLAYEHATTNVYEIFDVLDNNTSELFLKEGNPAIERGLKKSNWYMKQYGKKLGLSGVYNNLIGEYNGYAFSVLNSSVSPAKIDSVQLLLALKVMRQQNKILRLFDYELDDLFSLKMEANVLLAMGKRDEAIQALENIIDSNAPQEIKTELRLRIDLIKSGGQ
jgi:hypothetical protein